MTTRTRTASHQGFGDALCGSSSTNMRVSRQTKFRITGALHPKHGQELLVDDDYCVRVANRWSPCQVPHWGMANIHEP